MNNIAEIRPFPPVESLRDARDSAPWPRRRQLVKDLAERLASEGPSEEFISSLRRLAADPKWEVRKEVADHLQLLPQRDFTDFVAVLQEDRNAFVRRSAQRALDRRRRGAEATDRKRRSLEHIETEYARIERFHGGVAARRARRMAERLYDVLVGAMVHDLQNIAAPLDAAVKALCGKSAAGEVDPQDLHRRLGRMARQTSDLLRILDDLHVYASHSSEPGRPETLEDMIVQSHSAALAALKIGGRGLENVRVRFEVDKRASLVCNRNQMVRALANIIKNAYEAHSPAPREFRSGEVWIVGRRLGADHIQFVVADNGMGIPPDELRSVLRFVPGSTSKKAMGTGFGLPIARRMIQRHGGSLAIESNEGVGTQVTITIPIKPAAGAHPCTMH